MTVDQYINNINAKYKLGNATEHTFRGLLEQLLESIVPEISATNEPKRQQCGAPDYIITKKNNLSQSNIGIPVGFIEAKDIGDKDLAGVKKTGNKEQFDRYKNSLNNLIFTDYIDFHLYNDGIFVTKIAIAEIQNDKIVPLANNFATFTNLIKDFCATVSQTIKNPKKLAEMMAGKARLLSDVIEQALISDGDNSQDSTLKDQMNAFKEILIHDITPKGFADVYAQTIAYGMFAARLHDPTLPTFSRQEAAELIPKSNPFLRKLFGYIAGPDLDDRIKWIVDSLVEIFLACNIAEILKIKYKVQSQHATTQQMEDPIIHFYETFLSEYDPKLRKARGVWYTPKPVVNFIIRAVDDILKTEFDLPQGLADNSKTKIKENVQTNKGFKPIAEREVHRVQILDPATGTGTFLAEVVKHIHAKFKGQQGVWSNYVETHLLPRLNGFELLMASYAMAHLQMDLLLTETGFKPTKEQRFKIYLTNSLEESHPDTGTLFANWLSSEANEANFIKRDTPVMCIVGNPPYSGISTNNGDWITKLIDDYKYVDGVHFNERKHWLNDDYVKFIRFSQYFIEKNGSGVLAFINPHGFLDNPTFRGMRWNLLKTYDKIYTIDLHGNAKKKETSPDGSADVNVFDIMQGVAITFFVKTGKKKPTELGKVFHYDLFGKRDFKYDFLSDNSLKNIKFQILNPNEPNYFFIPKNDEGREAYERGFNIEILFSRNVSGIVTMGDEFAIGETKEQIKSRINDFKNNNSSELELKNKFNLGKNYAEFILKNKHLLIIEENKFVKYSHRPFDCKWTYFDNKILWRWRLDVMKNFIDTENIALVIGRQSVGSWQYIFCTKFINDFNLTGKAGRFGSGNNFPLYLYPETNGQLTTDLDQETIPKKNAEIVNKIAVQLNLKFTNKKEKTENSFAPIDILDYIYAVLHSPTYREKYKEFLKIDFPKIPYPKNTETFWKLVALGSQIREIHLLESPKVEDYITEFNIDGDCVVGKPMFKNGNVFINETQNFENVPEVAWNFYIGGYQPAQKWLKDRKGRKLELDDIAHYQKIIVALTETNNLIKKINLIDIE